ncbi:CDP-glycerol glycerophosphotransferase family protein [Bacillus sp. D-CC]
MFFNRIRQEEIKKKLFLENPNLINKKVILYAPTFRDKEINSFKLQLEIEEMYREFHEEYVLFIRLHPAIKEELYYKIEYSQFIYDYSMYPNINDLFLVTDIIIPLCFLYSSKS